MVEKQIINGLRAVMKAKNVKLTELGRKLNIPYRTLQEWFACRNTMSLTVYIAICNELGVSGSFGELIANLPVEDDVDQLLADTIDHFNMLIDVVPPEDAGLLKVAQIDLLNLVKVVCELRILRGRA